MKKFIFSAVFAIAVLFLSSCVSYDRAVVPVPVPVGVVYYPGGYYYRPYYRNYPPRPYYREPYYRNHRHTPPPPPPRNRQQHQRR